VTGGVVTLLVTKTIKMARHLRHLRHLWCLASRRERNMMLLPLTMEEALALDRLLDLVKQGVKEKKSFIKVQLNNIYFTNALESIAKKKYIQEQEKEEEKTNG
jgi:hypothetical protein